MQLKREAVDYNPDKSHKEYATAMKAKSEVKHRGWVGAKMPTRYKYKEYKQWACQLRPQPALIKLWINMESGFKTC